MQELLLILREISDLIIRRSSVENYLKEKILSPVERQQLEKTVQTVRHDLLQAAFFRDPLCRPFVMHSLDVILAITKQLHKHQNELFSGMLAGEPLPVNKQLYDYELECTKLKYPVEMPETVSLGSSK